MVLSRNPLNACLLLIATFFSSSCVLFIAETDYLPIIFVLVYVGAIMVLFLFVIMMLNLRITSISNAYNHNQYILILVLLFVFFIIQIVFAVNHQSPQFNVSYAVLQFTILNSAFVLPLDTFGQFAVMNDIGILLYSKLYVSLIIAGFCLLLAMIGAIILTLNKNFKGKTQQIFKQVLQKNKIKTFENI
jgi:NADH:ubiquinone oxidoreductase subunit 6 (subunit J)